MVDRGDQPDDVRVGGVIAETVFGVAWHVEREAVQRWYAVRYLVVIVLQQGLQGDLGGRADAELDAWREAEILQGGHVQCRRLAILKHGIDARCTGAVL